MHIISNDWLIYYCAAKAANRNGSAHRHEFSKSKAAEDQIRLRWGSHVNAALDSYAKSDTPLSKPDMKEIRHLRTLGRRHKVDFSKAARKVLDLL